MLVRGGVTGSDRCQGAQYDRLFLNRDGIIDLVDPGVIVQAEPIHDDCELVKAAGIAGYDSFFLSRRLARRLESVETLEKYHFNAANAREISREELQQFEDGPVWK